MIKTFIDKLFGKAVGRRKSPFGKRREVPAAEHHIDPALVDERASTVVRTLQQAGYQAYIVGGAVRDLLVGMRPKDFDVATDATPEQVKGLFRRAFIIGRRFRIVHVVYGRGREHEVIEVSTFRAFLDNAGAEQVGGNERTSRSELAGMKHAVDASGRVLRDNVWGTQEQDAARRDFTINAMYYDPQTQLVIDYHGGIRDSVRRVLRMIGDPAQRYREDPVRIIRAVRFSAKLKGLGFTIDPKTAAPLAAMKGLLADVPQSRMFDETLKLLQTGHALATIEQLQALGLGRGIYPLLDLVVERAQQPLVRAALQDTDRRVGEGRPVAPSFLLACVLWSDVLQGWRARMQEPRRQPPHPAMQEAIDQVFSERIGDVSGGGRLASDMREIWMMQPRFEKRVGNSAFSLVEQPRFRAGLDFMRLRADAGEMEELLPDWWQQFSTSDDTLRADMLAQVREEQARRMTRAPRPARKTAPEPRSGAAADGTPARTASPDAMIEAVRQVPARPDARWPDAAGAAGKAGHAGRPEVTAQEAGEGTDAPRKRRRRRRPAGARAADGQDETNAQAAQDPPHPLV